MLNATYALEADHLNSPWHDLLSNIAILTVLISIWSNVRVPQRFRHPLLRQLGFGLLLGLGAISVMNLPFKIGEGIYIDLRPTVISVAGFFGGPVSLMVCAVFAGAFRLHLGGDGTFAGLTGIAIAGAVGMISYFLKRKFRPSFLAMLAFSVAVAVGALLGFLALPWEALIAIAPSVLLPTTTIVFASTLMVSLAISNELRRRDAMQKNHVLKIVIDSLPDCLNVKDTEGRFIVANPATASLMKATSSEALIGKSDVDFYPEDIAQKFAADEMNAAAGVSSYVIEQQITHLDGSTTWLSTLKSPLLDQSGRVTGVITHNRDVTVRKQLEIALAESERRATAALTNMADGLIMFDKNLEVVFCNEQYRSMFPLTADLRVPGTPAASILYASIARGELINIPAESVTAWVNSAVSNLRSPGTVQFPLFDGRWIESRTNPAPDGSCFVVCSDITTSKQSEQALRDLNLRLSELAETDALTNLLNRRAFDRVLYQGIESAGRGGGPLSLLLLDVDYFKAFNDTYGHAAGDDCLRAIAGCMRAVANRPTDYAARYGGEEMALILPNTPEEGALTLAHNLSKRIRALSVPHAGSEKGIVTVSIGVATLASNVIGSGAGLIIQRADEALYRAKASGRDLVRAWEPSKPQLSKAM
jgi:diguanylate cyclase (GGDEF)-like protein/PAS domain S-box-containing protein